MTGGEEILVVTVGGMHCPSCGLLVDEVVEELPGVASSTTDVRAGRKVVRRADGDGAGLDRAAVIRVIVELGYSAVVEDDAAAAGAMG